jgi:threonine/homoserine/homoserine lactone efflux protein
MVFGVVILPGMDMAFVLASALSGGRRAGLAAVAGIITGGVGHVLLTLLGVGLLLQAAPRLYNALLLLGSGYIVWIGYSIFRSQSSSMKLPKQTSSSLLQTFLRALATCLLNPKAYVFMLAVFPQFLNLQQGQIVLQAILLGSIIAATQLLVYGGLAMSAATLNTKLIASGEAVQAAESAESAKSAKSAESAKSAKAMTWLSRCMGIMLVLAGVLTAWQAWLHTD